MRIYFCRDRAVSNPDLVYLVFLVLSSDRFNYFFLSCLLYSFPTFLPPILIRPGTVDPEMIITACQQFTLWAGWDRGTTHTLGNMRQSIVLKTDQSVAVVAALFQE